MSTFARILALLSVLLCGAGEGVDKCHTLMVDGFEVNHVHDGEGNITLSQVVYWKLHEGKIRAIAWRNTKESVPYLQGDFYVDRHRWRDGWILAKSRKCIETHTYFDVERYSNGIDGVSDFNLGSCLSKFK